MVQQKRSSKKVLLIAVGTAMLVCIIFGAGLFFFIGRSIDTMVAEEEEGMRALSPQIRSIIKGEHDKLLMQQAQNKPVHFKKYIYFSSGYKTVDGESYAFHYDSDINNSLKTSRYAAASDLDGLIFEHYYREVVGYYEDGDVVGDIISVFSDKEQDERNKKYNPEDNIYEKKAERVSRVLTYVSVPDLIVLKRDTVWGDDPPQRKKSSESGMGSIPTNGDIVKQIRKTIQ